MLLRDACYRAVCNGVRLSPSCGPGASMLRTHETSIAHLISDEFKTTGFFKRARLPVGARKASGSWQHPGRWRTSPGTSHSSHASLLQSVTQRRFHLDSNAGFAIDLRTQP